MIYNKLLKYLILIFFILYSNVSVSNDSIYYVDMEFLMNNSIAGKSIIKQLDQKNKSNQNKLKKINDELVKDEKKIVSQKNILSEEEYKNNIKSFNKKVSDYRLLLNNGNNNILKIKNKAQKDLIKLLTPILAEYAGKNSISYIIAKQNIIIGKSELDLTDIILKKLNSKIKKFEIK
tara:strand:- start:303 stop:833 length:531 start_codon:yes stop_codon:yes gene_type:complete